MQPEELCNGRAASYQLLMPSLCFRTRLFFAVSHEFDVAVIMLRNVSALISLEFFTYQNVNNNQASRVTIYLC